MPDPTHEPSAPPGDSNPTSRPGSENHSKSWVHVALFLTTILTTTSAGAVYLHADHHIEPISDGLPFSIPLLLILVCHEMGHFLTARAHGVNASWPYFLPLPPPLGMFGTLGAMIRMPPATDRRKLIDIGAAGPLAGILVAIPVLCYGLSLSEVRPLMGFGEQEGNSILYAGLKLIIKGRWLPGGGVDVMLHPTALAGWAGLLVTMLNLLPFGQLDGGHVAVAYFGNRYPVWSRRLQPGLLLLALAVFAWVYRIVSHDLGHGLLEKIAASQGVSAASIALEAALPWLVWFALLRLMRRLTGMEHPPVEDRPIGKGRVFLFWVVVLTFILIFMPVPLRTSVAPVDETLLKAAIETVKGPAI